MKRKTWFERLNEAIDMDARSPRRISLDAGLGPNFISQMRKNGKDPSAQNVIELADTLGVSVVWIFTGAEMSVQDERLLAFAASLDDQGKEKLLDLFGSLSRPA